MNEYPGMPSTTGVVLIVTSLLLLAYEAYLLYKKKEPISVAVYKFGQHSMAIVFLVGFLMGHFFW
jgi:hypothetical protein